MKVLTILGTRPEIIRLSLIIARLDALVEHILVHTGQNFVSSLSDVFFEELAIRQPDHFLGVRGETFGEQIGQLITSCERVLKAEKPDRLLLLGDTNSALSAIVAKRLGIHVFHMEAGNRCYDDRVPEEVNRRVIDHCSDVWMPYTERSRSNLLREGIPAERIFVTGNPIHEVMQANSEHVENSHALERLGLEPGQYFLATVHRAENVDVESRLRAIATAFEDLVRAHAVPVIVSTHPRTRQRLGQHGLVGEPLVRWLDPFGFADFVALERSAKCVLTDSGTVQEECAILGVPVVTVRDVTERPETIECGGNVISGVSTESIHRCVRLALDSRGRWSAPPEYLVENVSDTVVKIVLGYIRGGDANSNC